MGQSIDVTTTVLDGVALLIGDRSITGQDGEEYDSASAARAAETLPGALAAHLFDADHGIEHVSVQSNVVTAVRPAGWDDACLDRASETLHRFFRFYPDDASDGPALSGVGRAFDVVETAPPFDDDTVEELRAEHYNATLERIRRVHDGLWIVWVRADGSLPDYRPGQYCTLGLGYWEPRLDGRREILDPERITRRILRSFSMSSHMVDDAGELLDPEDETAFEFYVVLVERERGNTPALLTPRLFAKQEGDRVYLGRKAAGRYTLDKVDDPDADILFLSTGTGEAPHNQMILQLLRDGHRGRILSSCTVRYAKDLAYLEQHRALERRYPTYTYLPLTTREEKDLDNKVYVQDLITSGTIEEELGAELDSERTHVFLCGNPAMIGLPEWEDDEPTWPEPVGVAQLLAERGFTLDRRGVDGNVHYEEYW
jgi:ferredoxin/flavodoxin---NADP+ reductase